MGRRAYQPEPSQRRQAEAMAGYGVSEKDIARVLGIDPKTLRKHYRDELDTGQIKATAKVAESLFRKATGDGPQSVTAAIFWLKTRGQWKETLVQEVKGETHMVITTRIVDPEPSSPPVRGYLPAPEHREFS
jgi:hypothetical protein